jgi:hypothetical protein
MGSTFTWVYADARGLEAATRQAAALARSGARLAPRDVRALLAHTCVVAALLSPPEAEAFALKTGTSGVKALVVDVPAPPATDAGVRELQFALASTWATFVPGLPAATPADVLETKETKEMKPVGGDAGLAPLAAAAIVAAVGIAAAAQVYTVHVCAEHAALVVDRYLDRSQKARLMLATHAEAIAMAEAHAERERAKGEPLPMTEAELAVLRALLKSQEDVRTSQPGPAKPPEPPASSAWTGGLIVAGLLGLALIWKG